MLPFDYLLLGAAVLLLLGVFSSKASGRLGVPSLLLFLAIGMLAGSEGVGGIDFDDYDIARNLGILALIFILFSGGFNTSWAAVRPVLAPALVLATVGVALTALLLALFAVYVLDLTWLQALLLGAIVSSTDAAAVFAILRSRGVGLQPPIAPLIELESGSNDPMAVFLTTTLVGLLVGPTLSGADLALSFVRQMLFGALLGVLLGRGMVMVLNRIRLEYDGLYPVLSVALVLFVYGATTLLGGNGFLAIYLAGIAMGNAEVIHRRSLTRFHDGLAWLMQIVMFLALGLLVFPSRLLPVALPGLLLSAFLILVARPLSVLVGLAPFRLPWRAQALVGWVGLRGSVPIILATFPLTAGVEGAERLFNLVFFIVLTSVIVQGSTIPQMARRLGVHLPVRQRPRAPLEFEATEGATGEMVEIELPPDSPAVRRRVVDLGLPRGALLVMIERGGQFFVPSGSTTLDAEDHLFILADEEALAQTRQLLRGAPRWGEAALRGDRERLATLRDHLVVVGHGRVGQHIASVVRQMGFPLLVVDRDGERLAALEGEGIATIAGDAAVPTLLQHAGLERARALVVAIPDETTTEMVVEVAHGLAPALPIVARAATLGGLGRLVALGARDVIQPELEGGLEVVRHTLLRLGLPSHEVQKYTDAVRRDHYDPTPSTPEEHEMLAALIDAAREMEIEWVRLDAGSEVAGRTILDANLRAVTGASVVAIVRGSDVLMNPKSATRFEVGDVVGMIGDEAQLAAARRALRPASAASAPPPPSTPPPSPR